jgi:HlyD family secretion protein
MAIPLISIDMSVGAPGQIRPAIERIPIATSVSGRLTEVFVRENVYLDKNTALFTVESQTLQAKLTLNRSVSGENSATQHDLEELVKGTTPALPVENDKLPDALEGDAWRDANRMSALISRLNTPTYVRQLNVLTAEIDRRILDLRKLARTEHRLRSLLERRLVSDQEYEEGVFARNAALQDTRIALSGTLSRWQAELHERRLRAEELESEHRQLVQEMDTYVVRAPISGVALGFRAINPGVFVQAGQILGEISPGELLQADIYVSPKDIGFITLRQRVNLQVDAFPYTEWGMVRGSVQAISPDFVQLGSRAAFKVVVELAEPHLRSGSGKSVDLRRGMTVNARFVVRKRSLFNVLFGKMSESFDPIAAEAD